MDSVIFEDPSKQRLRAKRPPQVQPIEAIPNQNDPTGGEQQSRALSQKLDAFIPNLMALGGLPVSQLSSFVAASN